MFFSVCIPVYNTSKYLEECVESVLAQTEKDYEIVLIDDGSTDESGSICDRYAEEYPFIRVFHKANEGLLLTRRFGFKVAEGDYLMCLDSDDRLNSTDALLMLKKKILEEKCDLIFFEYLFGGGSVKADRRIELFELPDGYVFYGAKKEQLYNKILFGQFFNPIVIKVFSKEILDIYTDYNQINKGMVNSQGEDLLQSLPLLDAAEKVVYLKQPLYYYRWNESSISRNVRMDYYDSYRTIYGIEDFYIKRWNIASDDVSQIMYNRMQTIIGLVGGGYHNKSYSKMEWSQFVHELSKDKFFRELYKDIHRQKMILFNRFFAWLIYHDQPFILRTMLEIVDAILSIRRKVTRK